MIIYQTGLLWYHLGLAQFIFPNFGFVHNSHNAKPIDLPGYHNTTPYFPQGRQEQANTGIVQLFNTYQFLIGFNNLTICRFIPKITFEYERKILILLAKYFFFELSTILYSYHSTASCLKSKRINVISNVKHMTKCFKFWLHMFLDVFFLTAEFQSSSMTEKNILMTEM